MRTRTLCLLALAGLALAGCGSLPDPFVPYGTYKAQQTQSASGEFTGLLTYDPNVRMKTEEESSPVAWAQMQPRTPVPL